MGTLIALVCFVSIAATVTLLLREPRRRKKRKETLREASDGTWHWIDFDGTPRQSATHPEKKGGEWYSEPGGDGHDGGGDGGGGGD